MRYYPLFTFILIVLLSSEACSQKKGKLSEEQHFSSAEKWFALADSLQDISYQTYLSQDKKYFIENNTGSPTFNYWWNAHALDVFVDGYLRTKDEKYKSKMKAIVSGIKGTNGGSFFNDFYDDMGWLALASLRAHEATQDQEFFEVASLLWTDIQTGLNNNQGGGIAWRKSQPFYKNTPANGPAIILACRFYKLNKDDKDLKLAKELYSWLKKTLVTPSGFVLDGINRKQNGLVDRWKLTYNQGLFIGAALELHSLTKEQAYLNDAIKTADYLLNEKDFHPKHVLKNEGGGDGGLFKGILIRYLTDLIEEQRLPEDKRENYRKLILSNAEIFSKDGLKRPEMLANTSWDQKTEGKTDFSTQLSAIMLIEASYTLTKNK